MCCKPLARYSFRHFRKSCRRLANQELRLQLRIFSPTFPLICGLPRLFPRVGLYKEGNNDFFLSLFFTARFMLLFCPCCIMNPALPLFPSPSSTSHTSSLPLLHFHQRPRLSWHSPMPVLPVTGRKSLSYIYATLLAFVQCLD